LAAKGIKKLPESNARIIYTQRLIPAKQRSRTAFDKPVDFQPALDLSLLAAKIILRFGCQRDKKIAGIKRAYHLYATPDSGKTTLKNHIR
jgi:hypothetical protein